MPKAPAAPADEPVKTPKTPKLPKELFGSPVSDTRVENDAPETPRSAFKKRLKRGGFLSKQLNRIFRFTKRTSLAGRVRPSNCC